MVAAAWARATRRERRGVGDGEQVGRRRARARPDGGSATCAQLRSRSSPAIGLAPAVDQAIEPDRDPQRTPCWRGAGAVGTPSTRRQRSGMVPSAGPGGSRTSSSKRSTDASRPEAIDEERARHPARRRRTGRRGGAPGRWCGGRTRSSRRGPRTRRARRRGASPRRATASPAPPPGWIGPVTRTITWPGSSAVAWSTMPASDGRKVWSGPRWRRRRVAGAGMRSTSRRRVVGEAIRGSRGRQHGSGGVTAVGVREVSARRGWRARRGGRARPRARHPRGRRGR